MKVDGSQFRFSKGITEYVRHYMRYFGINIFVDPFCGLGHICNAMQRSERKVDKGCVYYASDFNPFIMAINERLWQGGELPEVCDRDKRKIVADELKRRFRNGEGMLESFPGFEDWEIGCYLILGTLHQNVVKGYIGDIDYANNIRDLKKSFDGVKPPDDFGCCDYMDMYKWVSKIKTPKLIYCDFPEPTAKNMFPFGMYFDRDEFFENTYKWSKSDDIVIFSSKYFPDNGRYEIIYESGGQKLYVEKRWYVEDIINAAPGYFQKYVRPARTISEQTVRRKRKEVPRSSRGRRRIRLEEATKQL